MKRYGMVVGLRAEKIDEYKKLHAAVWPDVLGMIKQCHIQNYSIYLRQLDDGAQASRETGVAAGLHLT